MFRFRQYAAAPVHRVAAFYGSVQNLLRISPPVPRLRIHTSDPTVQPGKVFPMSLDLFIVRIRWESMIEAVEEGRSFTDTMHGKLIRFWRHVHRYEPHNSRTLLIDEIECDTPWWFAGCVWLGVHALFLFRRYGLRRALS